MPRVIISKMWDTLQIAWMFNLYLIFNRLHFIEAHWLIVNGTSCGIKNHPYYIALYTGMSSENGLVRDRDGFLCGGSLIKQNVVLTAAHCCHPNSTLFAVSGLTQMGANQESEQTRVSKEIEIHPKYIPLLNMYDLCLIKLREGFDLTEGTQLIELATPALFKQVLDGNKLIDLIGYGYIWSSSKGTPEPVSNRTLHCAQNVVSSTDDCLEYHKSIGRKGFFIPSYSFCTIPKDPQGGICSGDSGGPVVYNGIQVGVNSAVMHACGATSIFMRVDSELEFLTKGLGNNVDRMLVAPVLYIVTFFMNII